jgi:ribosome biogenesis protein ENP2
MGRLRVSELVPSKCYEMEELSCKFERALEEEIVDFELLTDDFSKLCMLGASNTVTFHAKYGHYHSTRLPCPARSLRYDRATCDLYITGSTSDLLRLNLEAGRFLQPISTDFDDERGINVVAINPLHSLLGLAGADGVMEFRDPRAPQDRPLARLDVAAQLAAQGEIRSRAECREVSALEFRSDGLHVGAGTSSGHLLLYDLRMAQPLFVKDHRNEQRIHTVRFHEDKVSSADSKVIKMWDHRTGASFLNLETDSPCCDFLVWPDSGLVFAAGATPHTMAYYCPAVGKAPRWCSFLDSVTEEMEERKVARSDEVFENFKFVTREDLSAIGGDSLIGTKYVRRYMHGFFVNSKLYKQMWHVANPGVTEELEAKRLAEKVEEMRASRISADVTVSKKKAQRREQEEEEEQQVQDDRFKALQSNPDFAIDESQFAEVKEDKKSGKKKSGGGGGKKVRMFEANEDNDVFAEERRAKSKLPLGQRAAAAAAMASSGGAAATVKAVTSAEMKFLSKETLAKMAKKKEEKRARIEHNKTRRKLTGNI